MPPFSTESKTPSETGEIVYQPISFDVVPVIANRNQDTDYPMTEVIETSSPQSDGFDYVDMGDVGDDDGWEQPLTEDPLTFEECKDVTMMIVNIPQMFGMDHLQRDEAQCTPFAKELHKYCSKKNLDPRDWFFDEFGMVLTGFGLVGGMYRDHKEHKRTGKKSEMIDVGTGVGENYHIPSAPEPEVPEERPEGGVLVSSMGGQNE